MKGSKTRGTLERVHLYLYIGTFVTFLEFGAKSEMAKGHTHFRW